jgi:HAD superfamily hydrolase (TIGR01509 family)
MPSVDVAAIDVVTVDAFGTLLRLDDPVPALRTALAERSVDRDPDTVRKAFQAEAAHYRPRSLEGRDPPSLERLRHECVRIFLDVVGADLAEAEFVPAFLDAIVFQLIDGADSALARLQSVGLSLACVANWDVSLGEHLRRLGVGERFRVVVTSAAAGAEKPHPAIFFYALERLGVPPDRALHIGNEAADRDGARAAGLAFEPAPLATLPERLGL